MKKLISIILSLCLLLSFAAAENAPAAKEPAEMTAEELYEAGSKASDAEDYAKAKELWEQGAEKGSAGALNGLGYLYELGLGVEQSNEKALEYCRLAADQGFPDAMVNLAMLYKNGIGVEQSWEKAMELNQQAADLGDPMALNNIGDLYENGFGVEQDYEKAMEYYRLSADQGSAFGGDRGRFSVSFSVPAAPKAYGSMKTAKT